MASKPIPQTVPDAQETESHRIRVGPQGRIVIPAELREALGIKPGDTLYANREDGRLVLETREHVLAKIRALFAHVPKGVSVVDELIEERRAEAAREAREMREWLR